MSMKNWNQTLKYNSFYGLIAIFFHLKDLLLIRKFVRRIESSSGQIFEIPANLRPYFFHLKAKLLWILKSEDQSTNDEILFKTPIFEGFGE